LARQATNVSQVFQQITQMRGTQAVVAGQATTGASMANINNVLVKLDHTLGRINIPDIVQHQVRGEVQVNFLGNHALTQAIALQVRQIINAQVTNAINHHISLSGEVIR
jgi:hypothetical protein